MKWYEFDVNANVGKHFIQFTNLNETEKGMLLHVKIWTYDGSKLYDEYWSKWLSKKHAQWNDEKGKVMLSEYAVKRMMLGDYLNG